MSFLVILSWVITIIAAAAFGVALGYLRSPIPQPRSMEGMVSRSPAVRSSTSWMIVSSLIILFGPIVEALASLSWTTLQALLWIAITTTLALLGPFRELEKQEYRVIVALLGLMSFDAIHPHTGHILLTAGVVAIGMIATILLVLDENSRNRDGKAHKTRAHMRFVVRAKWIATLASLGFIVSIVPHIDTILARVQTVVIGMAVISVVVLIGVLILAVAKVRIPIPHRSTRKE